MHETRATPGHDPASAAGPVAKPKGKVKGAGSPRLDRLEGLVHRLSRTVEQLATQGRAAVKGAGAPGRRRAQSGAVRSLTVPLGPLLDARIREEAERLGWSQAKVAQDLLLLAFKDGTDRRLGKDPPGPA